MSSLSSLICDTDALREYPVSCCRLVSQQQNILCGPHFSTLGRIEGPEELRWGEGEGKGAGVGEEEGAGDDIICVLGGEIMFGIKAGALLGS